MKTLRSLSAAVLCLVCLPVVATEQGNLMKMTSTVRMQMAGMPAGMGPMTHTVNVCTSASKPDLSRAMKNAKDCTISDYRQSGDTISYHLSCSGAVQLSGDGKFQRSDNGDIHGSMHMAGQSAGHAMTMDTRIDGTRIGSCDYTPPSEG